MTRDRDAEIQRIRYAANRLYYEMQFSIIPCHHPWNPPPEVLVDTGAWEFGMTGKRPSVAWKRYQETRPTNEEIQSWFAGEDLFNIAIVTGPLSQILVIDLDDPDALSWAESNLPKTPLRVNTWKGEHWYYRWDSSHPLGNAVRLNVGSRRLNIDIRGSGGYVIAPGSRHQSEHLYRTSERNRWRSGAIESLPHFPAEIIRSEEDAPPAPSADAALQHRLIAYINAIPPEDKGGRNNTAFRISANLLHDFGADPSIAWPLLAEWNNRNTPPLPEKELRSTFHSAEKGGTHAYGWKRDLPERNGFRLINGGSTVRGNLALAAEQTPIVFPMMDFQHLPEESGWEYVIDPMIPRRALTILSGDGGMGKSLLAAYIVSSIAAGRDLLGNPLPRRFRSTIFFLEDPLPEIRRRLLHSGHGGDSSIYVFDNRDHDLVLNEQHVAALERAAIEHGSDLIAIDPIAVPAAAAGINLSRPLEVRKALDLLTDLAKRRNLAIFITAHHNAMGAIQGGPTWENASRSHLAVYRHPTELERNLIVHTKDNAGRMASLEYEVTNAVNGDNKSKIVRILGEAPMWTRQILNEVLADRNTDKASIREAILFLRRQLPFGIRKKKSAIMEAAGRDNIRTIDLLSAATVLGIERKYIPQPHGQQALLCWELPGFVEETHSGYGNYQEED